MAVAKTVATPSDAQTNMVTLAAVCRTLMGGTRAMRMAGSLYLPQEPAESAEAYKCRLARSTLFNGYAKTVSDMTGKVFQKPIILEKSVPESIQTYAEDIDMAGRHINVFARDAFFDAMQIGVGYILTDMPPKVGDGVTTVAAEKAAGVRPYLVYIPVERLLGWKSSVINGAETLSQVRILECVSEPDGDFDEKSVEQVRVLEPGNWRTFRKTGDKDEWIETASGKSTLNKITLTPFYTNRAEFMTATPPLANLADTNVAHWQSQSDQRNILHVARVPILFGAGINTEDKFEIGANSMVRCSDPAATLTYVEHSGAAIGAGDKDLQNLEMQMQAQGLQLLIDKPGGQSATGEIRDDSKENSPLAMMARSLADALEISLGFMAEYLGLGADKGGEVIVNTDFGIQAGASVDIPNIIAAEASGLIDKITALEEMKRRGFLADNVDPETVKARAADEMAIEAKTAMDLNPPTTPGPGKPLPK